MKVVLLVLSLALFAKVKADSREAGVANTNVSPNCTCGWANKNDQRIVNGRGTKQYEYPMLAGLVVPNSMKMFCGGTIITRKHVLTAAHCTMRRRPASVGIHVGSNNYDKVKWSHGTYIAQKFNDHPLFDLKRVVYDISVITIEKEFPFSRNIGPACLPTSQRSYAGQKGKILGWGRIVENGPSSTDLLQVDIDIRTHEYCHKNNPMIEKTNRHQICTYTENKDSCQGDSGGPVLWLNPVTNRYTLIALVSYGYGCAKVPAVNTDVGYFMPWVQEQIAKTSPGMKTCGV